MLAKFHRLNLKKDFKFVQNGKRVETASLRLVFREGESQIALIGIALISKAFKNAVERNRAKRLSSMAIQVLYPRLKPKLNLVIMPKSQILHSSVNQLIKELENVKGLY